MAAHGTATKTTTTNVIAVYDSIDEAERAVQKLVAAGIPVENISIVGQGLQSEVKLHGFVTTGDIAKQGASIGAVFGGLMGFLLGTAFFFIPGAGPLVVLGPMVDTLVGAAEGALAGGLFGALFGTIVEKQHIPKYEQYVRAGKYLLVAQGDPATAEHAHEVLGGTAASDVETHTAEGVAA
jgi:uncharacterized membrane protein